MSSLLTLALLCAVSAAAPAEVVLNEGESLVQAAKRAGHPELTDAELRALNSLADSQKVPAGTRILLPGKERALAHSAMETAKAAYDKAAPEALGRKEAKEALAAAEQHFKSARYAAAGQSADKAWELLGQGAQRGTTFAVEVTEAGNTKVRTRAGRAVTVDARGVTRRASAGQIVQVTKGEAPSEPKAPPAAPSLLEPKDARALRFKANPEGLGPVLLRWKSVAGAQTYEVLVTRADGKPAHQSSHKSTEATLPRLAPGSYRWSVLAVDDQGERSEASATNSFDLAAEPLKLEVEGSTWK